MTKLQIQLLLVIGLLALIVSGSLALRKPPSVTPPEATYRYRPLSELKLNTTNRDKYFVGQHEVVPTTEPITAAVPPLAHQARLSLNSAHPGLPNTGAGDFDTSIKATGTGSIAEAVPKSSQAKAGLYQLKVTDGVTGQVVSDQTVAWGVLVFNSDYAAYPINTKARLAMAVLDDRGKMICDAELTLAITEPNGRTITLSTANNQILVNEACFVYGLTEEPDYVAEYLPTQAGNYQVALTARIGNGVRVLHDQFSVVENAPFYLQRVGASRTYPAASYPYTFNFQPTQSGRYQLTENVPGSFEILDLTIDGNPCPTESLLNAGACKIEVSEDGNEKQLIWRVDARANRDIKIAYTFKGPSISPYLFRLGPAEITSPDDSIWTETRSWLIASDAACQSNGTGGGNSNASGSWQTCGGTTPQAADSITILSGDTITMNAALSVTSIVINNGGIFTNNASPFTLTLTGTTGTLFTLGATGTFTPGTSISVTMNPNASITTTSGTITFFDLNFTPTISASNKTYTMGSGALTINGNWAITGTAASNALTLTVNMSANVTVASTKTTTIGPASLTNRATLDVQPSLASYNLTTGTLAITALGTLNAANATSAITVANSYSNSGIFTAGSSTVSFTATATGKTLSGTLSGANGKFFNVIFNGVGGAWAFGAAVEVANDFTVTNGAVTASNNNLSVTRDFTLAYTAGVSYVAGSSTVTVARHFNDPGVKYVSNTSELALDGTGTLTTATTASLYDVSLGQSGNTTTLAMAGAIDNFNYYASDTDHFRVLLFDGSVVKYKSAEITPPGTGVRSYTPPSPVPYKAGWSIGIYTVGNGVIPYTGSGGTHYYQANNSGQPNEEATISWQGTTVRTYSINGEVNGVRVIGNDAISRPSLDSFTNTSLKDTNNNATGVAEGLLTVTNGATLNGGTVTGTDTGLFLPCSTTCSGHLVFNSPTTLSGSGDNRVVYSTGNSITYTVTGGTYGSWNIAMETTTLSDTPITFELGGNIITDGFVALQGSPLGGSNSFNTAGFNMTALRFDAGSENQTGSWVVNLGASTITLDSTSDSFGVASNGGSHTFNLSTSSVSTTGDIRFINGTGTVAASGSTSTITMTPAASTTRTFTTNAQTIDNFVVNGGNGAATVNLDGNLIASDNLTITAGTLDVTATPYSVTIGGNYSNSGSFTPRLGTVTFNATDAGNTLAGTMTGASAFYNLVFDGVAGGWSFSAAVTATNDFTVTNGDVTANNNNLTVTRDFTLTNVVGVSYTAGSSTITVSRDYNNPGDRFVRGTSLVILDGTGNVNTTGGKFNNLSLAYTSQVSTFNTTNFAVYGVLTFNGGTANGSVDGYVSLERSASATPIVFASATTLSGTSRTLFHNNNANSLTTTIAGGNYGTWNIILFTTLGPATSSIYQLAGNITNTGYVTLQAVGGSTGNVFNTQNFNITSLRFDLGTQSRTGPWTVNFGSSTLTLSDTADSFGVASNGGSHTFNLSTAAINTVGNVLFANGTGTVSVSQGTSTVTWAHPTGTKTYAPNSQSLHNLTLNSAAGTLQPNGAVIATGNFIITAGSYDTVAGQDYALTIGGNYTNSGTFNAQGGTVTLNGSATQTLSGTMVGGSAFNNLTITNNSGTSASDCERTSFVPSVDFNAAAWTSGNYTITTANVRVEYNSGSTYAFTNINWNGQTIGTQIYFRNSVASDTWLLDVSGTQTAVSYVNVSRSNAASGLQIVASDGTNTDCNNNSNWLFVSGALSTDIVNAGGTPIDSPSIAMGAATFSLLYQTVSGIFGATDEKVRVSNTTVNPQWSLTIAASSGPTGLWSAGTPKYDFNDPTGSAGDGGDGDAYGGQLTMDVTGGTLGGTCSTTGITKGSSAGFSEGVVNSITLLTASGTADVSCYWDLTGVDVLQTLPSEQATSSYSINMTLTITAN